MGSGSRGRMSRDEVSNIAAGSVVISVSFYPELDYLVASITASDSVLASCLTMAWKLVPQLLIESLVDHRAVTYGEFFTFAYEVGPDRDPDEAEGVHIREDERETVIPLENFEALVVGLARLHFSRIAPAKPGWYSKLSVSARALIQF
jgi:hypothetical protein